MTKYPEGMTNDEIPNDERSPKSEIRMTKAGVPVLLVMAAGCGGKRKTFNAQRSTLNVQVKTGSSGAILMPVLIERFLRSCLDPVQP